MKHGEVSTVGSYVVIPYQFRSVSIWARNKNAYRAKCRNPLSIQVCFNSDWNRTQYTDRFSCRNPLSIQVCFNAYRQDDWIWRHGVVIPYQFRSVSMTLFPHPTHPSWLASRNPLSIQVCFNRRKHRAYRQDDWICRNPLSIQVCFNTGLSCVCLGQLRS